ncbi:major ampullate spidroin 2, putative [Eimeria maxima]|uniref:Major ampullate spidroin 2, putative n=1 Tax=Eimeria maxima TaxID=5804 RepID=U6M867_EIMMA|nr:major ampullate spidroin 2, putative [Eimeria maxima]CDJ60407.1 major ampullate spidroin 2, putative [Eimeria maxima]
MGFTSASAAEMGLSKTEYEDAVNLEKLYFLANSHDQCALCGRGGVSSVDLQRYEFLCNGCSAGKTSAKKIGTDRFTAFEVQKLLNKFGGNNTNNPRDSGSSRLPRSSSSRATERRRRHGRGHSRRRDTPSPSSETQESSDDSPPRSTWAPSRSRGNRGEKNSSSRRKGAHQEDFVAAGWPQPNSNVWTGAPDTGAPQGGLHQSIPGMGGLAGMGMAAVPHAQQQQPQQQQHQPSPLWRQGQTPQGLMTPSMQQMQMPQHGATIGSFVDASQQQWRACGGIQPQQHMQQVPSVPQMQALQQPNSSLFGVHPQQQALGVGGTLGRPLQMVMQQQSQPNLMLQQHQQPNPMVQMQQLQQPQQQRNPFASMRGPQQPAARSSNPFACLQGSHFAGSPFQQPQPQLQQPQLQQTVSMQQAYRPPGMPQQSSPFGVPVGAPSGATVGGGPLSTQPRAPAVSTNPFSSMSQAKWAPVHIV